MKAAAIFHNAWLGFGVLFLASLFGCAQDPVASDLTLQAKPTTVNSGDAVTLSWSSENVDNCQASGDWSGVKASNGSEQSASLQQDATFTLSCQDLQGLPLQRQIVVSVTSNANPNPPPNPNPNPNPNPSAGLDWFNGAVYAVDSHYIHNPALQNPAQASVYVFNGNLAESQIIGANITPAAELALQQTGPCSWGFEKPVLNPALYTVALSYDGLATISVLRHFDLTNNASVDLSLLPQYVLHVGAGQTYATPSAAVSAAEQQGLSVEVIEIEAGTYNDDTLTLHLNNVTLRGVNGRAHLDYTGSAIPNGKGIWSIQGNNTRVENIEFSGAKVSSANGAGIRFQGSDLSLCQVYSHHNENGFLGHGGVLDIEFSEFFDNGYGDVGHTHNLYIDDNGSGSSLIFKYNYSHGAHSGHNLKTRAKFNDIRYNRIMDEADGNSSYLIDISNGGYAILVGNVVQQGSKSQNSSMIRYGAEGLLTGNAPHRYYVYNNTLVNDYGSGRFINPDLSANETAVVEDAVVQNNLLVGAGNTGAYAADNVVTQTPAFANAGAYDYHLSAQSPGQNYSTAVPLTIVLESGASLDVTPYYQYAYDINRVSRVQDGALDAGAFEYQAP